MSLRLGNLKSPTGSTCSRKRLGRGPGSGLGKTSGKGHKGHKARAGYRRKAYHEGGQMPLYRKIPKRGFTNPTRKEFDAVNVARFERVLDQELTPEVLARAGVLGSARRRYKVLGQGEVQRALTVHAHAFSKTAREKIERAGGRCEVIS